MAMVLGGQEGQLAQEKVLPTLGKQIRVPPVNSGVEEG